MNAPDVRLRRPDEADAPALAALMAANWEFLAPYGSAPARPHTAEREAERLRQQLADPTAWPGVIEVDGVIAGRMNLHHILRGALQTATVGYYVAEEFGGRGVAKAALAQVLDVAFGRLGLHRLEAGTLPDNLRSQRVLRACGFEEIGLARSYLLINEEWRDHVLFQVLAHA
ncbi:GNAT family N-acetyltransferase [Spongisporangium articulatum]|uniref:GNAT family N-acetyltransferase n=1 Tax=Spongisporangium articulatum TaxID=3362603 RepID=A0ABW8APK3_9ACTN